MKKGFLILFLFTTTYLLAGQIQTVNLKVSELAEQYKWQHDTSYLSFKLNDVITITGASGNAKYCSDRDGKSLRYYQNSKKGEFAIQAAPGIIIQSVKLSYYLPSTAPNSVATSAWVNGGKKVSDANQVKSDVDLMVNANSVVLYTGRTDNNTGGQIRITNFSVTYVRTGNSAVNCTSEELANQYGWADQACLRNFDLNEAISVEVDSARTMKYNMNTKQLHCYQWLGGFTIRANGNRTIKSIKLTYFSINSGVLTRNWGKDGKQIPSADRILNEQVLEVNAQAITLYIGTTDTVSDGQVRIKRWEVEYTEPHTSEMLTRSALDLGKQNGWADGYCPVNIPINNALSLHSDQTNNAKYYSTTRSLHCYQSCGGFYLKARMGAVIKSVALLYESLNNGVLTQNWGTDGKNIPDGDWIESGATISVNADSVHFFIGDKLDTKNCQIHLTGFTIVYADTLAHIETFSNCAATGGTTPVQVMGNKGYYTWQLSNFQRSTEDFVGVNQGIRLQNEGAIATDGVQEGGVKDVSFDWCATDTIQPVRFVIKAGERADSVARANPGLPNGVMNYTSPLAVKSNCAFSIAMNPQASTATNPIIGPVTITPYLLFKKANHVDSIDTNRDAYDLKTLLMNNTDEVPVYEIVSNTTGDSVGITNGVVDLSTVLHKGLIRVKASCFGGAVYTTLTLYVEIAPRVYFTETNKVVKLADAPFVNPLVVPDSIGAITYSSSDGRVATVNDTGLVMITGLGQALITAHVAASEKYIATAASFNLSVVYQPKEGTYRLETFSKCKKKKVTEGFVYVEGDEAVYDWNLTNFSRDKQDSVRDSQGIRLYYGGSISSNGAQEGGIKYLSFDWRSADPVSPVHFVMNTSLASVSYSQPAVGDASLVLTYSNLFEIKSNTSFSINVRAKENPAQSQLVVGPITIMPYLLFENKYLELELPQTSYDCATNMIDNTEGVDSVVYSVVSSSSGKVTMKGSVVDLSQVAAEETVRIKAQWGGVSTTMTLHLTVPTGLSDHFTDSPVNRFTKFIHNGEIWIYKDGRWYSVLGIPRRL